MKKILSKIPYLRYAYFYRKNSNHRPGHYYSSVINIDELQSRKDKIWQKDKSLPGIDFNIEGQKSFFSSLAENGKIIPFQKDQSGDYRYFYDNQTYPLSDGLVLFSMLNTFKPERIIEIGSGFSSALILDTRDKFFTQPLDLTFIEPYPDFCLNKLLKKEDYSTTTIIKDFVQNIEPDFFKKLEANDILLIDNSHVSKAGSDVNYLMTEILPILNKGVIIHIHDVFYPFEYPSEWIFEHRLNWNEIYSVHNFLLFNTLFKIIFFSDYVQKKYYNELKEKVPSFFIDKPGSIWIQRV